MILRLQQKNIEQYLKPNKVVILLGTRRVGKTVLIKQIEKEFDGKTLLMNAEDSLTHEFLSYKTATNYKSKLQGIDLFILDEAQVIPDIGSILKLIVDEVEGIRIIATGSSSFDLLNRFGEPLTGRSFTFKLFPFSIKEFLSTESPVESMIHLEDRLVYGMYPELLEYKTNNEKEFYLKNLINNYLLKDIYSIDGIRGTSKIMDLLKLIAYQTGNEVSLNELGNKLGMSKNTVEKYLDLLSKVFIIYELKAFSKNLRKEVTKSKKWYFYDNGIRNAIIDDFSPVSIRKDIGSLWENFIISERLKWNTYNMLNTSMYFWRTYDQQEIDLIEQNNAKLEVIEIKWNKNKSKIPKAWIKNYPETNFTNITKNNFTDWLS